MNNEQSELLIDSASSALSELTEAALETATASVPALAVAGGGPAAAAAAVGITLISTKAKKYFAVSRDRNALNVLIDNCISAVKRDMQGDVPAWCKPQILEIVQKTELKAEDLVNRPSYIAELAAEAGNKYNGNEGELVSQICSLVWSSLAIAIRKTEAYQKALEVKCHELSRQNNRIESNLEELWRFVNVLSDKMNAIWKEMAIIKQSPNYQRSFARIIDNSSPKKDNRNPFHYRNNILPFVGRREELKKLQDFLDNESDLLWMSVTGEGGVGKSKLLYHFAEILEESTDWKSIWVTRNLMDNIMTIKEYNEWRYPCNLLLIVDYAAEVADELGEWIERLSETKIRPPKLRFVLIEREPVQSGSQTISSIWFDIFMGGSRRWRCLKELHYGDIDLRGMDKEDEYLEVIREFVLHEHEKTLSDKEIKYILVVSRMMDSHNQFPRILFVIIVADAYVRNREFSIWNVEKLIENVIERYKDHWKAVIEKALDNNEADAVMQSLLNMLLYATATGGWIPDGDNAGPMGPFAESAKCIADLKIRGSLFSMVNCSQEETDILNALEPDLIGECFVMMALTEMYHQNKKLLATMIATLWEKQQYFSRFIIRSIQNYYNSGEFTALFDEKPEVLLPQTETADAFLQGGILNALISYQPEEKATETIKKLEEFVVEHADAENIGILYIKSALNLSERQPEEKGRETIKKLEEFVTAHVDDLDAVSIYIEGLVKLSEKQPEEKGRETIKKLEEFVTAHVDDRNIVTTYIVGLIKLSERQQEEKGRETIKKLEEFAMAHMDDRIIVSLYILGLINLPERQPEEKHRETIKKLEEFVTAHVDDLDVVSSYTEGLIGLSERQQEEKGRETIKKLEEFVAANMDNLDVMSLYIHGLIMLSERQPEEKGRETIKKLEEFVTAHVDNPYAVHSYITELYELFRKQPEEKGQ